MAFKCETELPHLWEDHIEDINKDLDERWMKVSSLPMHLAFQWETNHKRFGLSCEAEVKIVRREQDSIAVDIIHVGNSLMDPSLIKKYKHRKRVKWPMKELDPIEFI